MNAYAPTEYATPCLSYAIETVEPTVIEPAPVRRTRGIDRRTKRLRPDEHHADALIQLAQTWIPYGGPPHDEVMVQFGMTMTRFLEVLRRKINRSECAPEIARRIHSAYFEHDPLHSLSQTDGRASV